ncbi:hypothetical protein [Winogradskyella sp.]|uniref:hypothetical protein n=1 Tax=Winogradskyella sp. TaxID=1883156 RepID=UPI0026277EA0|nr:hypothetical protein [Winogradskyella sp.]
MKYLLFFVGVIFNAGYAQTKNDNLEIYLQVFSDDLRFGQNKHIDTLIIEEQKLNRNHIDLWRFEIDSIVSNRINTDSIFKSDMKNIIQNFEDQNTFKNDTLLSLNIYLKILTRNEALELRKEDKNQIRSRFFIRLCKINYSGNLAALRYNYYCGGRCAGSDIIIFERIHGKWNVLTKVILWIA